MAGITATYVDADTFTVVGDLTDNFIVGRRVKLNCQGDGTKYGTVLSSAFTSLTTVNLTTASDALTSNLTEAWFGIVGADNSEQSLPEHSHDGTQASGGVIDTIEAGDSEIKVTDAGTGSIEAKVDGNSEMDITDAGVRLGGADGRVNQILDEDDMASDLATALISQQSAKAYADQRDFWKGINLFDNAAFQIAQRNYPSYSQRDQGLAMTSCDRWFYDKSGRATHTAKQDDLQPNISEDEYSGNIPEDAGAFNLYLSPFKATGTLETTDYAIFGQRIPKSKLVPLIQNDFLISFYMTAGLTGTYCLSVRNEGASNENLFDSVPSSQQDGSQSLSGGWYDRVGQTIKADSVNRGTLTKASFFLRKVLSPTGNAIAELYEIDGHTITDFPTGSALATSGTFDVSTLTGTYALTDFTFTDNYKMVPNKNYAIVVTYTGGDGSNYVEVGTDATTTEHYGTGIRDTGGWSTFTGECIFYAYETSKAPDRYFIKEFTISSANTWEYQEISIPKIDISVGTWGLGAVSNFLGGEAGVENASDELGLIVSICQFAGTGWNGGTADSWQTGNKIATTNQVNASSTTSGRVIRFYQPKLEIGSTKTPFYVQPYDEQMAIALRHFERIRLPGDNDIIALGETLTTTTTKFLLSIVKKRILPTLSLGKLGDSDEDEFEVSTQGTGYAISKFKNNIKITSDKISIEMTNATTPAANFVSYLSDDGNLRHIDFDALI